MHTIQAYYEKTGLVGTHNGHAVPVSCEIYLLNEQLEVLAARCGGQAAPAGGDFVKFLALQSADAAVLCAYMCGRTRAPLVLDSAKGPVLFFTDLLDAAGLVVAILPPADTRTAWQNPACLRYTAQALQYRTMLAQAGSEPSAAEIARARAWYAAVRAPFDVLARFDANSAHVAAACAQQAMRLASLCGVLLEYDFCAMRVTPSFRGAVWTSLLLAAMLCAGEGGTLTLRAEQDAVVGVLLHAMWAQSAELPLASLLLMQQRARERGELLRVDLLDGKCHVLASLSRVELSVQGVKEDQRNTSKTSAVTDGVCELAIET